MVTYWLKQRNEVFVCTQLIYIQQLVMKNSNLYPIPTYPINFSQALNYISSISRYIKYIYIIQIKNYIFFPLPAFLSQGWTGYQIFQPGYPSQNISKLNFKKKMYERMIKERKFNFIKISRKVGYAVKISDRILNLLYGPKPNIRFIRISLKKTL